MPNATQHTEPPITTRDALIAYIKIEYPDYDIKKPVEDKDNRRILDELNVRIFPSSKRLRKAMGIKGRAANIGGHEFIEAMMRGAFPHGMAGWVNHTLGDEPQGGNAQIGKFVLRYRKRREKIPPNENLRDALRLYLAAKTKFEAEKCDEQIELFLKGKETHLRFKQAIAEITKEISGKKKSREHYLRAILAPGSAIGNIPMPYSHTHLQTYTARRHNALIRHIRPNLPRKFSDAHNLHK